MSTPYEHLRGQLAKTPKKWLITGVAGFIGSNLLETLLKLDQEVVGLDNFVTGYQGCFYSDDVSAAYNLRGYPIHAPSANRGESRVCPRFPHQIARLQP